MTTETIKPTFERLNHMTFYLEDNGDRMSLSRKEHNWKIYWEFIIERKNGSGNIIRFDNLRQLEKMYPSWKGIANLSTFARNKNSKY